jgi:hypothetical protein
VVSAVLLAAWFAIVVSTTLHHEYWRDEVRPWSLAGSAQSFSDLFHRIRYEGHPMLWYLLLYGARTLLDAPVVLPILSLLVATAAMTLFMLRAPFSLWFKSLFLFGALPLYEYSVMARNYGISMLLLFVVAWQYPRRSTRWVPLAIALALLANTNVHSIVFAALLALVWAADSVPGDAPLARRAWLRLAGALGVIALGVVVSVAAAAPPPDTVLTDVHSTVMTDYTAALREAAVEPAATFTPLFLPVIPWTLGHIVLYAAVFGLLIRPPLVLAALVALLALGVMFRVAYIGSYRHAGLFLCFLLTLYWIAFDSGLGRGAGLTRRLLRAGCYAAVGFILVANVYKSRVVAADVSGTMSSAKAFGDFLRRSPELQDAIIVPEPDYYLEALPFYAPNSLYFPREERFGTTVTWSSASKATLSLGELLAAARRLKDGYHAPVLVAIGHPAYASTFVGDVSYPYRKRFRWSRAERLEAERILRPVATFRADYGNESFWVYIVR